MKKALLLAEKALSSGEIPVGCVILRRGIVIASSFNSMESDRNRISHCELKAISDAFDFLKKESLLNPETEKDLSCCDMFVSLEPCPMCAGAIMNSRVGRLFFGTYDSEKGGCLSKWNITSSSTNVFGGIMESECESLLKVFFAKIRK